MNWWPWLLLLVAAITAVVLYYRMDFYRRQVHAEEALPQHDADTLRRRLDHLPEKREDYRILCYRLALGLPSERRALGNRIDELDLERRPVPEHPDFDE